MFGDASMPARPADAPLSLRDRALALRDRIYASAGFRRFAIAFPLTRFVARRRARALFDLVAGFVYSQTLHACVSLDLFEIVASQPRRADELADLCRMPLESMMLLLNAAVALDLLQPRSGDRFGLGPLGAALRGSPGVAAMVAHHAGFYADLADPVALLREGPRATRLGAYWPYARGAEEGAQIGESAQIYSQLMSASQRMVSEEILAHRPFDGRKRLLDIGGGDGTFARAVAHAHPDLDVSMCDLPDVARLARSKLAALGLDSRIDVLECDFKSQDVPAGADVISLVRILHDHDDPVVAKLLKSAWCVLPDGGRIVIAEPMSQARKAEPVCDAYFGFYLFAMGSGRPRRPDEIAGMLGAAGFSDISEPRSRMPLIASLITATKHVDDKRK